jgi:hypothetical protein
MLNGAREPAVRSDMLLRCSREKVAPAARILSSVIGLAMNLLDDCETFQPESLDDARWSVAPKIQRNLSAK